MYKVLIFVAVVLNIFGNVLIYNQEKSEVNIDDRAEVGEGAAGKILPIGDFAANFCNFPQAWTVSKGKGVNVVILYRDVDKENKPDWVKKVSKLAPEAQVETIDKSEFLNISAKIAKFHIILLLEPIEKSEFDRMLKAIKYHTRKGTTIILPAYFGPMRKDFDYEPWRKFVKKAANIGAIIVGTHGRAYQIGNFSYWKEMPVDIFALSTRVDGFKYAKPDAQIESNLEDAAYLAAGTAALLKGANAKLLPQEIKKIFQLRGRKTSWTHMKIEWEKGKPQDYVKWFLSKESIKRSATAANRTPQTCFVNLKNLRKTTSFSPNSSIDKFMKARRKNNPKVIDVFSGNTLDAGLILGLTPMGCGEWSFNTLNAAPAQKIVTGKGVVVAILDHGFDKEDPSLKNRLVKPGSVIPGAPVFSEVSHGTWMARDLVRIAPHVKIMPVRFCGNGIFGDADYYIKGIEYAVANGADIISISHQAIQKEKQEEFDQAVKKASQKGVTLVYIHYYGDRKDVIVTKPIEFALYYKNKDIVYVIGTNFIDDSSYYTWGVSQTAPIVSGVIAMMKEINPGLKPLEIKKILLESVNKTPDGYPILDALQAVKNINK